MVEQRWRSWGQMIALAAFVMVVAVVGSCRSQPPSGGVVYILAASDEPPIVVKHGSIDFTRQNWTSPADGWIPDTPGQKKGWTANSNKKKKSKLGVDVVGDYDGCPTSGTSLDWVKVIFTDGSNTSAVRFNGLDNSSNKRTHISADVDIDFKKTGTGYDPATLSYEAGTHILGLHLQGERPCTFTRIDDSRQIRIIESN
jgi:hypothetical protein